MFKVASPEGKFTNVECPIADAGYQQAQGARRQAQGKRTNLNQ
jgi:hypothetical protein